MSLSWSGYESNDYCEVEEFDSGLTDPESQSGQNDGSTSLPSGGPARSFLPDPDFWYGVASVLLGALWLWLLLVVDTTGW